MYLLFASNEKSLSAYFNNSNNIFSSNVSLSIFPIDKILSNNLFDIIPLPALEHADAPYTKSCGVTLFNFIFVGLLYMNYEYNDFIFFFVY